MSFEKSWGTPRWTVPAALAPGTSPCLAEMTNMFKAPEALGGEQGEGVPPQGSQKGNCGLHLSAHQPQTWICSRTRVGGHYERSYARISVTHAATQMPPLCTTPSGTCGRLHMLIPQRSSETPRRDSLDAEQAPNRVCPVAAGGHHGHG